MVEVNEQNVPAPVLRQIQATEDQRHLFGMPEMSPLERRAFELRYEAEQAAKREPALVNQLIDYAITQRNEQRNYAGGFAMNEAETKLFRKNLATPDARAILLSQDADKVMKLISTAPERSGWKFPEALATDKAVSSPSR